jgi:hypothetical protein
MKDWLLHGAIETDEKMAADLAGPEYLINRNNLLVLESKADMQKRGQASPDDGDALALSFAQPVAPRKSKSRTRRRHSGDTPVAAVRAGGCDEEIWRVHGQSVAAMVGMAWRVNGLPGTMALRFLRNPLLPPTWRDLFPLTAVPPNAGLFPRSACLDHHSSVPQVCRISELMTFVSVSENVTQNVRICDTRVARGDSRTMVPESGR